MPIFSQKPSPTIVLKIIKNFKNSLKENNCDMRAALGSKIITNYSVVITGHKNTVA